MTTVIETAEQFLTANGFQLGAKKKLFIDDLSRQVQPAGQGFRTKSGQKIDIENYLQMMLESGLYGPRPSVKQTYQPIFPVRSAAIKTSHKTLTGQTLKKLLQAQNIVLDPSVSAQVIEMLSENFIASDDNEKGIVFSKANDSEIGFLVGRENYTLQDLLNNSGAAKFVDAQATRIGQLQHKASLRSTAINMLEVGAKAKEVENLVEELAAFEQRGLKTNMKKPFQAPGEVQQEFEKLRELKGLPRGGAPTGVSANDDLTQVKLNISKIEVPKQMNDYQF